DARFDDAGAVGHRAFNAGRVSHRRARQSERVGAGFEPRDRHRFDHHLRFKPGLHASHSHLYIGGIDEKEEQEAIGMHGSSQGRSIWALLAATTLLAVMGQFLVGAVEEASHRLGLTPVFVGVIVVAIIGNAAEHSTAVLVSLKNKMDLALNIAIGSSMQIAL